ncbi:MAG: hypothetical protein ACREH4_01345 [Vitreimonas sp.]
MSERAYPLPKRVGAVSAREVADILSEVKANLTIETRTQAELYAHLCARLPAMAPAIEREVRLSERDRVDIWVNGIVIEVKLQGASKFAVYKQIKRYAEDTRVEALILATNLLMALPPKIEGKPAYLVPLGVAWMR